MITKASCGLFSGLDLHSSNVYCAIKDSGGAPIVRRRLPNKLPKILQSLEPFRAQLKAVAVESTYDGHWLVDGLQGGGLSRASGQPGEDGH
jgi:hypothetical protein